MDLVTIFVFRHTLLTVAFVSISMWGPRPQLQAVAVHVPATYRSNPRILLCEAKRGYAYVYMLKLVDHNLP